jgi:putative CocE/NonD family hydrolase
MFSHSRLVFVLSGLILAGSAYSLAADSTEVPNELLGQLKRYAPLESNNLAERIGVQDSTDYLAALPVEMRDGAQLAGDVVLPRGSGPNAKKPAIVLKMPYAPTVVARAPIVKKFLQAGYAFVVVTDRGTMWSDGQYHWLKGSKNDFYDTLSWVARQPWSNGKVGTWGCSSGGENQLSLTTMNHPAHKAAVIMGAATGYGRLPGFSDRGVFYTGGVPVFSWAWWYRNQAYYVHPTMPHTLSLEERAVLEMEYSAQPPRAAAQSQDLSWAGHLPSQDLLKAVGAPDSEFNKLIQMAPEDTRWAEYDFLNEGDRTQVPSLHIDSWYDSIESWGTMKGFEYLSKSSPNQYLIMGPTSHCAQGSESANTMVGERPVGEARFNYDDQVLAWFNHWMGNEAPQAQWQMPRVQYHVLGAQKWVKTEQWPPKSTARNLYLHSSGRANSLIGDGTLSWDEPGTSEMTDSYLYDPSHPVPSRGGGCCSGAAQEQTEVEMRHDVLVYSTPVLTKPLDIAGDLVGTFFISSSTPDTDLMLKLVDVYPDGKAYNVQDTALRLRYRDGIDRPAMMKPGKVYKVNMTGIVTASRFDTGHRLRIEITSSNFPGYERNLNTGGSNFDERNPSVATVRVLHDRENASRLNLPVIN